MKARFDRITIDAELMNGQPCIRGMRLTVRRVVEDIVLPLSAGEGIKSDTATLERLRDLWACAPDFPDRPADLQPEPAEIP